MEILNTKCCFVGIIILATGVTGLLKPRYVSSWWNMNTNTPSTTHKTVNHNFGVLPAKVEVQVRSPTTGFIYPGVMSTYNNGKQSVHAGVTAIYSTTQVLILGATQVGTSGGHAYILYTGKNSWTSEHQEYLTSADVRIRAWHPDDLPSPTFSQSGFNMRAADDSTNYHEIHHGIGEKPALTVVQYRLADPSFPHYMEGQGTSSHVNTIPNLDWGGIVFGVDEYKIRLWAPSSNANGNYGIYNVDNGWGTGGPYQYFRFYEGEMVINIWKDLESAEIFSHYSTHNISDTAVTHEYPIANSFDIDEDLVVVESIALDGYNSGYYFQAAGAATFDDGYSLAGLVFAYSTAGAAIRLWHPTTSNSYIVKVGPNMGAMSAYEQYSTNVNSTIKIWRGLACSSLTNVAGTTKTSTISTTTYMCGSGLALASGTLIRKCQIDDTWSGSTPVCDICIVLSNPANGQVTSTNNLEGGIATYSCDAGFSLVGSATSTCNAGMWNGWPPTCESDLCTALTNPTQGHVTSTNNFEGGIATYSCDAGFSLVGSVTLTCSAGVWNGTAAACKPDICTAHTLPTNGHMVSTNNLEGGIASFSCDDAFSLVGSATSTCSAGVWNETVPTCEPDVCTALSNPTNGKVTSTNNLEGGIATFRCNSGFSLVGSVKSTCSSGAWSGITPSCEPDICTLTNPENGQVTSTNNLEGGIANYSCDAGFSLVGSATSTCTAGSWSGTAPVCEADLCTALTNPTNGKVTSTNNLEGGIATYSCDSGFSLVGSVTLTCSAGAWNGIVAACETDICTAHTPPTNGQRVSTNNLEGGIATFSCDAGFSLVGSATSTCSAGVWNETAPTCEPDVCTALSDPTNGKVTSTNNLEGGIATFRCNSGFSLVGSATSTCSSGTWIGVTPSCEPDICTLTNPGNGQVTSTNNLEGGIATYSCDAGFSLVGSATSTCSAGTWSGTAPICKAEKCEEIDTGEHAVLDILMLTLNGSARFTCEPGYHHVSGNMTRECMITPSDKHWSGTHPVCSNQNVNTDTSEAEQIAEKIVVNLSVPIKSTKKYQRTLISVHDERISAFCIGLFGALICAGVVVLLVLSDLMTIIKGVCDKRAQKQK